MIQEMYVGGVGVGLVGGGGATLMEKCSMLAAGEEMRKAAAEAAVSASDPNQAPALKCPRCDSTNTKFCYYNNYNLTQPRHFCKACRRYWTKGGALRNVPIGGGCPKNKSSGSRSAKTKTEPTTVTAATATNSRITQATTSINATNISNTATNSCASSNLTEANSSPLNPTSISSYLMSNSHFLDSQNFLGFLRNGSVNNNVNHSSNMMLQRSISDSQSRDSLNMINAGGLWRGAISNPSYPRNQQLPFYNPNHQNQFGLVGDHGVSAAPGGAIQDLYLRLRAMTSSYGGDEQQGLINPVIGGNSGVADQIVPPAVIGDTGFWGSSLGWSDLHNATASASFP